MSVAKPGRRRAILLGSGMVAFAILACFQGDRFQFVPWVAGTWEYVCDIHGYEFGTITAFQSPSGLGDWDYSIRSKRP